MNPAPAQDQCLYARHRLVRRSSSLEMMETGQLMSFLSYVMQILMNLMMISMVIVMVTMGRASLQRIFEVLDEKIDLANPENPVTEVFDGSVEFKNVYFSYSKTLDNPVLRNINLKIKPGETVGITAPRFRKNPIWSHPRLYDATAVRSWLGVRTVIHLKVLQQCRYGFTEMVLFSGPIEENSVRG